MSTPNPPANDGHSGSARPVPGGVESDRTTGSGPQKGDGFPGAAEPSPPDHVQGGGQDRHPSGSGDRGGRYR
jgi:hypothetical protein